MLSTAPILHKTVSQVPSYFVTRNSDSIRAQVCSDRESEEQSCKQALTAG